MEMVLVGVNVLALMAIWRFMLRPSILDTTRDQLFDLRDELRQAFLKNGWGLDSDAYRNLRNLTNGYLRFTEEVNLMRMTYWKIEVEKSEALLAHVHERNEAAFKASSPDMDKWIRGYRRRGNVIAMNYAVFSSGAAVLFAIGLTPFVIAERLFRLCRRSLNMPLKFLAELARRKALVAGLTSGVELVGERLVKRDVLERYSLEKGSVVAGEPASSRFAF